MDEGFFFGEGLRHYIEELKCYCNKTFSRSLCFNANKPLSWMWCLLRLLPGLLLLDWIRPWTARWSTKWADGQNEQLPAFHERHKRLATALHCPYGLYRQKSALFHLWPPGIHLPQFSAFMGKRRTQRALRQGKACLGINSLNPWDLAPAGKLSQSCIIFHRSTP